MLLEMVISSMVHHCIQISHQDESTVIEEGHVSSTSRRRCHSNLDQLGPSLSVITAVSICLAILQCGQTLLRINIPTMAIHETLENIHLLEDRS